MRVGTAAIDLGPVTGDRVDYPDYGYKLAAVIADGTAKRGVAPCGSGIGISIVVNGNSACRCARVDEPSAAALSRQHNDADVSRAGLARANSSPVAVLCFLPPDGSAPVNDIANRVVGSGKAWISVAQYEYQTVLRACVTHGQSTKRHFHDLVEALDVARRPVT